MTPEDEALARVLTRMSPERRKQWFSDVATVYENCARTIRAEVARTDRLAESPSGEVN